MFARIYSRLATLARLGILLVAYASNRNWCARSRPWISCRAFDVCDEGSMEEICAEYRPALVFHSAAHKHVPLMEERPGEVLRNNVIGTEIVALLSGCRTKLSIPPMAL